MPLARQGSITGYFSRAPTETIAITTIDKEEVIDLTLTDPPNSPPGSVNERPAKRRKPSPSLNADELLPVEKKRSSIGDRLRIDSTAPFAYPPGDHPSYSRPPDSAFNHPFDIRPPSASLMDALSFSQSPKAIVKPSLNLDLLYFHPFITPPASRALYDYILDTLPWYRVKYTVRGINVNTPRWTTVFGKDASTRDWRGYNVKPRAIPEMLLRLMEIGESAKTFSRRGEGTSLSGGM